MGSVLGGRLGPRDIEPEDPTKILQPRPGSAAGVAEQIRAGQLDYADAVKRDPTMQAEEEFAVMPAWPAIGALVLAVLFVVVAIAG